MKSNFVIAMFSAVCIGLLGVGASAQATTLNYTILGVAGAGSTIDFGDGAASVAGKLFEVSGYTLSDVEAGADGPGDTSIGQFATVASFVFSTGETFISDASSGLYWIQNCGNSQTEMACAGLWYESMDPSGMVANLPTSTVTDINVGQPFVGVSPDSMFDGNGFAGLTNSSSYTLNLYLDVSGVVSYIEATATGVPEPASLLLIGLGLAGLGFSRRNKKA